MPETTEKQPSTEPRSATFELPWPPSVNNYFFHRAVVTRGRKPFVQKGVGARGKAFREAVSRAVWDRFGRINPIDFRLRVSIQAFAPNARKIDMDNPLKATLDALTHAGFWTDDSLVDDLRIIRAGIDRPAGKLVVTVEEILQPMETLF